MAIFTRYRTSVLTGRFIPDAEDLKEIKIIDSITNNQLHERYFEYDSDKDYYITNVFRMYLDLKKLKKNVRFIPAFFYTKPTPKIEEPPIDEYVMISKPTSTMIDRNLVDTILAEYGKRVGYSREISPPACYDLWTEEYKANGIETNLVGRHFKHILIRTQDDLADTSNGHQTIFIPCWHIMDGLSYNVMTCRTDKYIESFILFYVPLFNKHAIRYTKNLVIGSFTFSFKEHAKYRKTIHKIYDQYESDLFKNCSSTEEALDLFRKMVEEDAHTDR